MSKRKKIPVPNIESNKALKLPTPKSETNNFRFLTSYKWLKVINTKDFVNCHQSADDFSQEVSKLICETLPQINEYGELLFIDPKKTIFKHTHKIKSSDKEWELVKNIVQSLLGVSLETEQIEDSIWQIGAQQGARIIGHYNGADKVFYPLFIDWHHQIYPSIKYNDKDYANYKYVPY